jgi:hypothetical protein
MRFMFLAMLVLCLTGCVSSESLLGRDEHYVVGTLGTPERRTVAAMPEPGELRWMGPYPSALRPGEHFVMLWYPSIWNEQWFVILASPSAFERVYGHPPLEKAANCVIEIRKYPKGAVF